MYFENHILLKVFLHVINLNIKSQGKYQKFKQNVFCSILDTEKVFN